jgi:hypothetical protein
MGPQRVIQPQQGSKIFGVFERQNVQFKIVKINSELLKIKKIKQSQKVVVQAKFKIIYVKIWQKIAPHF